MATRPSQKHSRSPSPDSSLADQKRPRRGSTTPAPVKFLVISDTHGAHLPPFPPCNVVLHAGDLTEDGSPSSIEKALEAIRSIDAELKLVIAGNHEISLDKDYYLAEGGSEADHLRACEIVSVAQTDTSGVRFLEEGTHTFTLKSGACFMVYASPWTPKYGASAFQYPSDEDRFNPKEITPKWAKNIGSTTSIIPDGVDIVMTHGPPKYLLDATSDRRSAGCEHLRRAIARVRPRLHCFGHVHRGYGVQRIEYDNAKVSGKSTVEEGEDCIVPLPKEWVGRNQAKRKGFARLAPNSEEAFREGGQTLVVNAALMDENGELGNVPWIVELELPTSTQSY